MGEKDDKHTHDTIEMDREELDRLLKKSTPPVAPKRPEAPLNWSTPEKLELIIEDDDGEY